MKIKILLCFLFLTNPLSAQFLEQRVQELTSETLKTNIENPLPFFSSWNTGDNHAGDVSKAPGQLQRMDEGEYMFPVIQYYDGPTAMMVEHVTMLAEAKTPFSIRFNNKWNYIYRDHGPSTDSLVWEQVGFEMAQGLNWMEQIYPNPPLILMLDNNESVFDPESTDLIIAFNQGFYNGLSTQHWKDHHIHVGYGSEPIHFEVGVNWNLEDQIKYDMYEYWDGGSFSNYIRDWRTFLENDLITRSPQLQSTNLAYFKYRNVSGFENYWWEQSVWHGHQTTFNKWEDAGLPFSFERYIGFIKFGMWTLKPRIVREYLGSTVTFFEYEEYTRSIYDAIREIHENPQVRRFWRLGQPVISSRLTPLDRDRTDMPDEQYRYLFLESENNSHYLALDDYINVFPTALHINNEEFMLYCSAPLGPLYNVHVSIPGYGHVWLNEVPVQGSYWFFNKEDYIEPIPPSIPDVDENLKYPNLWNGLQHAYIPVRAETWHWLLDYTGKEQSVGVFDETMSLHNWDSDNYVVNLPPNDQHRVDKSILMENLDYTTGPLSLVMLAKSEWNRQTNAGKRFLDTEGFGLGYGSSGYSSWLGLTMRGDLGWLGSYRFSTDFLYDNNRESANIIMTWNGTEKNKPKFYVDGQSMDVSFLSSSNSNSGGIINPTQTLRILENNGAGTEFGIGALLIYDRILNQEEIQTLSNDVSSLFEVDQEILKNRTSVRVEWNRYR